MVEIVNMIQWKCALTMTAMVKPSAQIQPFQVSKGTKYALFQSSVIVLKPVVFLAIAVVRDSPVLDIYGSRHEYHDWRNMHLKASLFDHHYSLHHITSVFVPFFFSYSPRAPEGFGLLDTVIIYK